MLFRQAHNAAPTCSPSRAALLTGMSPHSAGQFGLVNRGFDLADPSRHLVHTLRTAGYRSTLCGIQHVRRDPRTIGYDEILNTASRKARDVAPAAAGFLAAAPREPFFLTVGFSETHRAFPPAGAGRRRPLRAPAGAVPGHPGNARGHGRLPGQPHRPRPRHRHGARRLWTKPAWRTIRW